MIRLAVLDLAPIIEGGDARLALRNSLDLARCAEADEVIVSSHIYDHGARLRSYRIAAEVGAHLRGLADKQTDQIQPRRR